MNDELKDTTNNLGENPLKGPRTPKMKKPARAKKTPAHTTKRKSNPLPNCSIEDALPLIRAIFHNASGEKVRRLTLLKHMDRSPSADTTRQLITNSSKYGLTEGSFVAEWIKPTEIGGEIVDSKSDYQRRMTASFKLAILQIPPFAHLYAQYKGKRIPTKDVMIDALVDFPDLSETASQYIDIFIVNAKFCGLIQTIAGSETLISIEQAVEDFDNSNNPSHEIPVSSKINNYLKEDVTISNVSEIKVDWSRICFFITPIGDEGSEQRRHADLFLKSIIEPALNELDLKVVRADHIGSAGMITSQIIEYVLRSRLAIVDMSFHNPNAFYEMAIRHASKLPIVQISRKSDRLPFDVNQVRTVVIDTTDIYTLVPRLETYRSEIATHARAALADSASVANPITVFFPGFEVRIPPSK